MVRVPGTSQEEVWKLPVPDVMTTNFWAEATDGNGKNIKSMDLNNVGWAIHP
jgi:hypothetical protein